MTFNLREVRDELWATELNSVIIDLSAYERADERGVAATARSHVALVRVMIALVSEQTHHVQAALSAIESAQELTTRKQPGLLASLWAGAPKATMAASAAARLDVYDTELELIKCGVLLRSGAYARGAYGLRASWKKYEQLLKTRLHEKALDGELRSLVLFGSGVFLFFVSLVPVTFQWLLRRIGFEGDRQRGVDCLRRCSEEGGARSEFALLTLAWIEMFFNQDLEKGGALLRRGLEAHPRSTLFLYLQGYYYRKRGDLPQAMASFQLARECSADVSQLQLACLYEYGWCQFIALDFDGAIDSLSQFLKLHTSPSFRAFAGYQLGLAYAFTDRFDEARTVFEKIEGWVRPNFTFDSFAARKAREYLAAGEMSSVNRHLSMAAIHSEALRHEDALQELSHVHKVLFSETKSAADDVIGAVRAGKADDAAVCAWISGVCLRALNKLKESAAWLNVVVDVHKALRREKYVYPHALCELGEMAFEAERYEEASRYLKQVRSHHDFDFDKPLFRRANFTLDRISKL